MEVYILDAPDDSRNQPNGCSENKTDFEGVHRELADIPLDRDAETHDVAARMTALKFQQGLGKSQRDSKKSC